jgi:hypothetical protein
MSSPTRKVSVRTPAILHILRQDRTRRLVRLNAIEGGRRSCEVGIEDVTEAEEGALPGLHQGPDPLLGRLKLDAPVATAHHARPAHRRAAGLGEGLSPILRRHLPFDEDHGLSHPPRPGKMALSTAGVAVTHGPDLHRDFRRLMTESAACRALSRLHHAADSVV